MDTLTPARRSALMAKVRGKDTKPELAVRRALRAMGRTRYRVQHRPKGIFSQRSIDIAFTREKVAVYVDGCFWHGCPLHYKAPKSNVDYWRSKVEWNKARDLASTMRLEREGWSVVRLWEHEVRADPARCAWRIHAVLGLAAPGTPGKVQIRGRPSSPPEGRMKPREDGASAVRLGADAPGYRNSGVEFYPAGKMPGRIQAVADAEGFRPGDPHGLVAVWTQVVQGEPAGREPVRYRFDYVGRWPNEVAAYHRKLMAKDLGALGAPDEAAQVDALIERAWGDGPAKPSPALGP